MMKTLKTAILVIVFLSQFSCASTKYSDSEEVTVGIGGVIPNNYGFEVDVKSITPSEIVLNNNWIVPPKPSTYHIGNNHYLIITDVDLKAGEITAFIKTRMSSSLRDAWRF